MPSAITVKGDHITLDLLLWRRFGRDGQARLEETLALNPGLAALGAVLPLGARVVLPDARPVPPVSRPAVSLFD
jgi:phage tail protein X